MEQALPCRKATLSTLVVVPNALINGFSSAARFSLIVGYGGAAAVAARAPGDAFVARAEQREAARVREAVRRGGAQGQLLPEQRGAGAELVGY